MMNLTQATTLSAHIKRVLAPYCDKIMVAGSIRRQKINGIKDVEIVAIPKVLEVDTDLFGGKATMRHPKLVEMLKGADIVKGDPESGKYIQFNTKYLIDGVPVKCDLFFARPENWGYILAIRTGSAKFSHRFLANAWKSRGLEGREGMLYWKKSDTPQPVPTERELFDLLGIKYVEPFNRSLI